MKRAEKNMSASQAEDISSIIRRSLERELALSESKRRIIEEEIQEFERRYGIPSEEFVRRFDAGELGDEQDCFEWWGLVEGLKAVNAEISKIRAVLSS